MPLSKLMNLRLWIFVIYLSSIISIQSLAGELSNGSAISEFSTGMDSQEDSGNRLDPNSCPKSLVDWVKDDFTDKSTIKIFQFPSEAKTCTTSVRSYQDYAQKSGQKTTLSETENLSRYLAERYKQVSPGMKSVLSKCNNLPNGQDKLVKTRYYMAMEKFEGYNNSLVDELAYIDSVLPGSNGLGDIECNEQFPFPTTGKRCKQYSVLKGKGCKYTPEQKMQQLISKTYSALNRIDKLEKAKKECDRNSLKPEACQMIQAEITRIENEHPWLQNANYFQDVRQIMKNKSDWYKNFNADVMKKKLSGYFSDNREALKKQYGRSLKHIRCMSYTTMNPDSSCKFEDARKLLAAIPEVPDLSDKKNLQNREFDSYVDAEKCLVDRGLDRAQTKAIIDDSLTDIGIVAATAGLGVVANGGLKMIKGMNGVNRVRGAAMATTAAAAANMYPGLRAAYSSCVGESTELAKFASQPEVMSENICPEPSSKLEVLKDAESSCLTDAILSSADVWPFVKALGLVGRTNKNLLLANLKDPAQRAELEKILSKNGQLSKTERTDAAEKLLSKHLDEPQKNCILQAHAIGGGKKMRTAGTAEWPDDELLSQSELNQKKDKLRSCGFLSTDISLLMRSGITGESPINLPPGADDYFRKRMQAAFDIDPSIEQVEVLVRANKYWAHKPEKAIEILKASGFSDEVINKIVKDKALEGSIKAKADTIELIPRPEKVVAVPVKPPPAVTSQSTAPQNASAAATLKSAFESQDTEKIAAAYKASKTEVDKVINKVGADKLSIDNLADFSTRGLSPSEAGKYAASKLKNDSDFAEALAKIDKRMADSSKKIFEGGFEAAQLQTMKVELMERYYSTKFGIKPGWFDGQTLWDKSEEAAEAYNNAAKILADLLEKRTSRWPTGQ
jgi:hypothetical protein